MPAETEPVPFTIDACSYVSLKKINLLFGYFLSNLTYSGDLYFSSPDLVKSRLNLVSARQIHIGFYTPIEWMDGKHLSVRAMGVISTTSKRNGKTNMIKR